MFLSISSRSILSTREGQAMSNGTPTQNAARSNCETEQSNLPAACTRTPSVFSSNRIVRLMSFLEATSPSLSLRIVRTSYALWKIKCRFHRALLPLPGFVYQAVYAGPWPTQRQERLQLFKCPAIDSILESLDQSMHNCLGDTRCLGNVRRATFVIIKSPQDSFL